MQEKHPPENGRVYFQVIYLTEICGPHHIKADFKASTSSLKSILVCNNNASFPVRFVQHPLQCADQLYSSHLFSSWLLNAHYVPGSMLTLVVNKENPRSYRSV